MNSIYLCGPIAGCSYDTCTDWRKYVAEKLLESEVISTSPLRGKEFLTGESDIADSYEKHILATAKAITCRDRFDVMNCDAMIANFLGATTVSIGSVIELGWADAFRKPIILVMEKDGSNLHEHVIANEIAGYKVSTLDDAIHIATLMLNAKFAKK